MKQALVFLLITTSSVMPALADRLRPAIPYSPIPKAEPARLTCKQASSCQEAVILWCGGYYGADRDHDGIPCETVCSTREEVEEIEQEIGCSL